MNIVESRIRAHYSNLTKKQRLISKFIIENMEDTAFMPISLLSKESKVSEASVTRFCIALGYDGYSAFQNDIKKWVKSQITPLSKIRDSIAKGQANGYFKIIQSDIDNLESLREEFPQKTYTQPLNILHLLKRFILSG